MKKSKLLLVAASTLFCSMMCSCILFSGVPLSKQNNDHPALLSGTWTHESKGSDGKVKKETIELKDYMDVFAYKNKDGKYISFILTKLGSYYFISMKTKDHDYYIFRIQFDQKELKLLGLNEKGLKLADNKVYKKTKDKKLKFLMSESELQNWCLQNAECFNVLIYRYKREVKEVKTNGKDTAALQVFANSFAARIVELQKQMPKTEFTNENLREYGLKMRSASYDLLTLISRAELPMDVRDAAIEYAQTYSSFANVLLNTPYLPKNASDAFAMGFVKGLAGDLSGGSKEIMAWQNQLNKVLTLQEEKKQAFLVALIKNGLKL